GWFKSLVDASKPLLVDFLALPGVARATSAEDTPIARSEAGFAGYFAAFAALSKAASVITSFGLATEEVDWIRSRGVAAGLLDLTALPLAAVAKPQGSYARWRRLADTAMVKT